MGIGREEENEWRVLQITKRCQQREHGGLVQPLCVIDRQGNRLLFGCGPENFTQRSPIRDRIPFLRQPGKAVGPFRDGVCQDSECARRSRRESARLEQSAACQPQDSTPFLLPIALYRTHGSDGDAIQSETSEELLHEAGLAGATVTLDDKSAGPALATCLSGAIRQPGKL